MPYIPEKHKKYHLLPLCRRDGGEVFDYPGKLINEVEALLSSGAALFPYNYDSYEEYYGYLDQLIEAYASEPVAVDALVRLKQQVLDMNRKEEWSVVKYVGLSDAELPGLTHGRNYYWPTRKSDPVCCGVVDDEEFTAYLYPTDAHLWQILEDPTGMAYRTIYASGKGSMTTEVYNGIMALYGSACSRAQDIEGACRNRMAE